MSDKFCVDCNSCYIQYNLFSETDIFFCNSNRFNVEDSNGNLINPVSCISARSTCHGIYFEPKEN